MEAPTGNTKSITNTIAAQTEETNNLGLGRNSTQLKTTVQPIRRDKL